MPGFTDWQDLGIFPLQDHDPGVPIQIRQQLVGGRIDKMEDPGSEKGVDGVLIEYAKEFGRGTLGDVHPWLFWQASRGRRGFGSWSMAWSGLTVGGGSGGFGKGSTGTHPSNSTVAPIRSSFVDWDLRYTRKDPGWPRCFPSVPKGTMVMVMPTTDESRQNEVMLHADPRLVCPNVEGPGEAGTLVVDLQPHSHMCMDGSFSPGKGGRHARLQSLMRVIALDEDAMSKLDASEGNMLALNYTLSSQDNIPGFGAIFGKMVKGEKRTKTGPITPRGPRGPITPRGPIIQRPGPGRGFLLGVRNPGEASFGDGDGPGGIQESSLGATPCTFGTFEKKREEDHGSALMDFKQAFGPIHCGDENDKHQIGKDKDGNPINSAHISTGAYIFDDIDRDGPYFFEGDYPDPPPFPCKSRVHLTWDESLEHDWIDGTKKGKWRWWAEVPYVAPGGNPSIPPTTPPNPPGGGRPGGPGRGGPITPRDPGGGSPGGPVTGGPITPRGPRRGGPPTTGGPITPRGPRRPGMGGTGEGTEPGTGPITPRGPPSGPITPRGGSRHPTRRRSWPPFGPYGHNPSSELSPNRPRKVPLSGPEGPEYGTDIGGKGSSRRQIKGSIIPSSGLGVTSGRARTPLHDFLETKGFFSGFDPHSGEPIPIPGVKGRVGETQPEDVALYSIFHPMAEGFAALVFRPQLWVGGYPSFEHNPQMPGTIIERDEAVRPQVLAMRAWGAQSDANGDFAYVSKPHESRARGGTGDGGVLFSPPHLEMEDYFAIKSTTDVRTISTTSYVCVAPGVGFALGTPTTAGSLNVKSIVIRQDPADTANDSFQVYQLNSSSAAKNLIYGRVDQVSDEVIVEIATGGNQAIKIPRGTTAQRPSAIAPAGGELRVSTNVVASTDQVEFYDQQGTAWRRLMPSNLVVGVYVEVAGDTMTGALTINPSSGPSALHILFSDTATAPNLLIEQDSTGDATIGFDVGGTHWIIGPNNSNGDRFQISPNLTDPGLAPAIDILTNRNVGIGTSNGAVGARFVVINGAAEAQVRFGYDQTNYAAFRVDSSGTLRILPTGVGVGFGIVPITNVHISESNTDTVPMLELEQLSTGDAGLQFSIAGDAYAVGIDNTDDSFKISYASTAGTAVLGTNDRIVITPAGLVGAGIVPLSTLATGGSFGAKVKEIDDTDSPYTAGAEHTIRADATNGAITINLPTLAGVLDRNYRIKKVDSSANEVTIAGASDGGGGFDNIDGAGTAVLDFQYESIDLVAATAEWGIH